MMKYYVMAGCAVLVAAAALYMTRMRPHDAHEEWRRYAVEPETAVRPPRFEAMKFHPEDAVEVRAPASTKTKTKKKKPAAK